MRRASTALGWICAAFGFCPPPNQADDELFFVEHDRNILADNTFSLRNIRYEAPRDLRARKAQVRYSRTKFDRVVVYFKGERMGEAHPVDFVANDRLNHLGKMLVPIIDDAHLMSIDALRRLRLLFEDFPKNHNLVLIAQPGILSKLSLSVNDDIKSRVTYSALVPKLAPDSTTAFILNELDRVALAHSTFTDEALRLIVRSAEGILRATRNLCIACLLEAVRDRTRVVDLKQVNRVLLQPHWRHQCEQEN